MYNELDSESELNIISGAQDGVLLSRENFNQHKRTATLFQQAKHQVKQRVKHAEQQAETLSKQAYIVGYERGMLMAMDAVAFYLSEHEKQVNQHYLQLEQQIRSFLSGLFNDDAVTLSALAQWHQQIAPTEEDEPLSLLIPESLRRLKPQIIDLLGDKGQVCISYHADTRFVMRYKTELAEFCPDELATENIELLLTEAKHQEKRLHQEGKQLSYDAITALRQRFEEYLAVTQPTEQQDRQEEYDDIESTAN